VPSSFGDDMAAFAAARVDWKETSKADLPGVQKEEVKVGVGI
jgi:hypothetical protein